MFYEAVGLMISAESDPKKREAYLVRNVSCPGHSASLVFQSITPSAKCLF